MQNYSNDLIEKIRISLEKEKTELETRITELSAQDPFSDPDRTNDNAATDTEANEESNHDRVSALISTLTQRKEDIDAALQRIGDGSYGTCVKCGDSITKERLSVLPTASICMKCEKEHKGNG